jgi:phosphoglycerol transferase MdoB-like AlkP superfamily enzyme
MTPDSDKLQPNQNSRLRFPLFQVAIFILLSTVLRLVLVWKFRPMGSTAAADSSSWWRVFGIGFLLDFLVAAVVLIPVVLWLTACRRRWLDAAWHRRFLLGGTALFWVLVLFMFQGEYFFFEEYASRYNTVAIDYIHYWTEVSGNITQMYPWKTVVSISLLGALAITWLLAKKAWPSADVRPAKRSLGLLGWLGGAAVLCGLASRIEFQSSSERVMNELSSNGMASGAVAWWTRELDYAHFYPTVPRDEAYSRVRKLLASDGAEWSADPYSIQRRIPGSLEKPRPNVVILVQESMGSEFWGCLNMKDGKPPKNSLTPALDKLAAEEGMLFTNLFADGNRTVRGLEAIFASFPPLPGDAILSRTKSDGCETIASVLARDGYSTMFMYGGRSLFDNMGPFMTGAGFQRFIEGKDFVNPTFSTVWGHCDEDLYDRVLVEARAAHETKQPFLIATMSVSNHQPFVFPEGRVSPKLKGHKSGARYSDVALGKFFEKARTEPFWNDTIFVVVADHGARVYGSQTVPVLSYEIPMLVLGPTAVKAPSRVDVHGCQLDVAPTILGMIGRPYDTVFYGRDLLAPAAMRFAVMHHNRSIALYRGDEMIALSLGKVVERFVRASRKSVERSSESANAEAAADTTALFQTAAELYNERRYRVVPAIPPPASPKN